MAKESEQRFVPTVARVRTHSVRCVSISVPDALAKFNEWFLRLKQGRDVNESNQSIKATTSCRQTSTPTYLVLSNWPVKILLYQYRHRAAICSRCVTHLCYPYPYLPCLWVYNWKQLLRFLTNSDAIFHVRYEAPSNHPRDWCFVVDDAEYLAGTDRLFLSDTCLM